MPICGESETENDETSEKRERKREEVLLKNER